MIIQGIRESSETNTPISVAKRRPSTGLSCHPFYGPVNCCLELVPKPCPAPLVPASSIPVFLGRQPMKTDLHVRHFNRLSFVP
jgi:hypothetical protein